MTLKQPDDQQADAAAIQNALKLLDVKDFAEYMQVWHQCYQQILVACEWFVGEVAKQLVPFVTTIISWYKSAYPLPRPPLRRNQPRCTQAARPAAGCVGTNKTW